MSRAVGRKRAVALVAGLGLLAAVGPMVLRPDSARAGEATPAAAGRWSEIDHPRPAGGDSYLRDVTVVAPGELWAVGYSYAVVGGASEFRTYGQHCLAGVCERADLPNPEHPPTVNDAFGVDGSGPGDVWAVGSAGGGGVASSPLAMHYDGTRWNVVAVPVPDGSFGTALTSVVTVSPTSAFAVGRADFGLAGGGNQPVAVQWDGTRWTPVPVPIVPGCVKDVVPNDVAAGSGRLVVVGRCLTGTGEAGFVLSRSADGWQVLLAPGDGTLPPLSDLRSVHYVGGSGFWVVGSSDPNRMTARGLSLRYDGRRWISQSVPLVGETTSLIGVDATAGNSVLAVGVTATGAFGQRLSLFWNGTRYVNVPAGDYSALYGVAYDPAGYWYAVGHDLGQSVIQRISAR